ncbi:oligopeptide transporter, OPT family [Aggregicoccus sp. 17bor-14]|uniref:OPT family oligopeptide transporter n=1 Tax=Myxococcaceae TaxID=31 RepID=UPI00129C3E56|nr:MULTISPECIES: oligopeptide transporter, OPT family [Myxococcaceae]MBF5044043.1 oligopeptide transporter, OPT family [Simulacricoccus sp. 17bor-14]MRI89794.1 oligopeptide transporter, OPT family [Aggregicoccus sp. 17bor-14]
MSHGHPPTPEDRVPVAQAHAVHSPYIPATQSPVELTLRGLVLGSVLGIVFAASSVYLAVKVGLTVSASIPIAVLSIAIFRAWGRSSILENTIVQTVGSAGESLAFGVAAALPALLLLGYDIDLMHAFLIASLGGVLGVLMMIPLRPGLIVQEHGNLTYPEGTACADVLIVGEQGGTNAKTVVLGFAVGGLYKFAYAGMKLWKEVVGTALSWTKTVAGKVVPAGFQGGSMSVEISPELLGVGYIIGPKVAGITFAGGVLSYLVLIPMIKFFGSGMTEPFLRHDGALIRDMSPDAIRDAYVLYIGAGAVATGGLISLLRSLPTIVSAFKRGFETLMASRRPAASMPTLLRTEQDLPITVVLVGSALLVLIIWLAPPLHVNFVSAVLIVLFGFFFVTVSARITGEIGSSSNPISGMVVATLLITCLVYLMLGWTSPADRFMALTTAAIVGIAASNGGTTAQDLKTAFLVGGTPRRQQVALFVGVLTSAAVIGLTLVTLNKGATTILPEPHPNQPVSELSDEQVVQHSYVWAVDEGTLKARGADLAQLRAAAFGAGLELSSRGATELRSWKSLTAQEVAATTLHLRGGASLKVSELGSLAPGPTRTYHVGYVRSGSDSPVPTGKYLVDEAQSIQYLVDPGIGGRVTEYEGHSLTRYSAPKAQLFALIIDGILTQKLPWDLVLLGVFISLMLELSGVSSLPFAVGVYLPISTSSPIFVGGLVRYFVDKVRGGSAAESEFSPGTLLSSGYIAGGAIAGVLIAFLEIATGGAGTRAINIPQQLGTEGALGRLLNAIGESEVAHVVWSNLFGFAVFMLLAALLLRVGLKGQSGAVAPPPAAGKQ